MMPRFLVVYSAEYAGEAEVNVPDPYPAAPTLLVEESSRTWRRANGRELRHFLYHHADLAPVLERMNKIPRADQKAERITRLVLGEEDF